MKQRKANEIKLRNWQEVKKKAAMMKKKNENKSKTIRKRIISGIQSISIDFDILISIRNFYCC